MRRPKSEKPKLEMPNLMQLPGEIRLQILYHLLVLYPRIYDTRRCRSQGLAWKVDGEHAEVANAGFAGLSAQILRVNRQLHSEGLPVLYGENAFNLETLEIRYVKPHSYAPWARIFGDNVRLIHHVDTVDLKLRYLGPVFPNWSSPTKLFRGFLHSAQALTSMRILVTEIYDVPSFDTTELDMVVNAATEAQNRSVSEMYQVGVILEASRLLKAAGWQSCHWYEAKEKYYVEPIFYVTKHPLVKLPNTLDNRCPVRCFTLVIRLTNSGSTQDAPTFLPLKVDYENSKVRRIGGPHTEVLGDFHIHESESKSGS